LKGLGELFGQILQLCEKAGLVKLGHVALDVTKVKANGSKHKAMSYDAWRRARGDRNTRPPDWGLRFTTMAAVRAPMPDARRLTWPADHATLVASRFHAVAAWRDSLRYHDEVRVYSSLSADGVIG